MQALWIGANASHANCVCRRRARAPSAKRPRWRASPHAALAWVASRPRYFTPSRGPKPRCLKFHPKYPAYPNGSTVLQGANHVSRVRNGTTSELADASCEMWIRELQAAKRGPWCCFSRLTMTPVYLSVYATNGELANLHRQAVSRRWASEDLE
jgi:hypothetical protein